MKQNAIPDTANRDSVSDVAGRIAQASLRRRGVDYADEVRRLLDAALEVMRRSGSSSRARVADIVATAGLSNEAFYRHFPSKDALVAAVLEDGTERLRSYLEHQMAKQRTPAAKIRRWIEGTLSQAKEDLAETTRAVLFNAGGDDAGIYSGRYPASGPLAALLHEPLAAVGSSQPELDALFLAHAVIGRLSDHLRERTQPTRGELDHLVGLCLRAVAERSAAVSTNGRGRQ